MDSAIRFADFDDPENRCRFYTRPTDFVGSTRSEEWKLNQARDAGPNALYAVSFSMINIEEQIVKRSG